ncbi:hypothetical protein [Nonomuraea sp. NPDC023979]
MLRAPHTSRSTAADLTDHIGTDATRQTLRMASTLADAIKTDLIAAVTP